MADYGPKHLQGYTIKDLRRIIEERVFSSPTLAAEAAREIDRRNMEIAEASGFPTFGGRKADLIVHDDLADDIPF